MWTVKITDQTTHSMQSDHHLHCPQKLLVLLSVWKELSHFQCVLCKLFNSAKWQNSRILQNESTRNGQNNCNSKIKLTLYQTIQTLNNPGKEGSWHRGKGRKCWLPAFSPFSRMFSTLLKRTFTICATANPNALNHSHTMTPFDTPGKQAFWKHCGKKGEIARNEQFLLFPQCFLPVWKTFFHFRQIWNCCLQTLSVWKSLEFVVW